MAMAMAMAAQADKIEAVPGERQGDFASEGGHDAEKQAIPQSPGLKRKLKSRHLQVGYSGYSNPYLSIYPLISTVLTDVPNS